MISEKIYTAPSKSVMHLFAAVYGWMSLALMISGIVAYVTVSSPSFFFFIHSNPIVLFAIVIAQIGLVIGIQGALARLSFPVILGLFFAYAATVGLTLSSILLLYTGASVGATFFTTAGMFGSMALYGHYTRSDLSGVGNVMIMILIGLVLSTFINLFLRNEVFDLFLSAVGVVVFSLLAAYDAQRIKLFMQQVIVDEKLAEKVTVAGALMLYLDFINLFLHLLRFMGRRREN